MHSTYNNIQLSNKEICNAVGCKSFADIEIAIPVGNKKIQIFVCNKCTYKFYNTKGTGATNNVK